MPLRLSDQRSAVPLTAGDIERTYGIDLVTAERIRLTLIGTTRVMHRTLMRGAFSVATRDFMDMSCALHAVTEAGIEMAAVTEGCTQHAFIMQQQANMLVDEWGPDSFSAGDVLLCNDSFRGAIHQADVTLLRPIYFEGELLFYAQDASHLIDMGGPAAGGFWNGARDLYEEGLRIPPVLLYSQDQPVRSTFNLLIENTRTAFHNFGDIRALYGALTIGERLLGEMVERHGLAVVRAGARYAMDYCERSMRAGISTIPAGTYSAEDFLDDDGIEMQPIRLRAAVISRGTDSIEIDLSGTERQPEGNLGTGWADIGRCVLGMKMIVDPATPVNSGTFRPIDVIAAPGSIFCALPPTSISNHMETGTRGLELVAKATGDAVPDRQIAPGSGTSFLPTFAGSDSRDGRGGSPWATYFLPGGGWGGWKGGDGISFCAVPNGNCRSPVIEHLEAEIPLIVWEHEAMIDSAGPGEFRGGLGAYLTVEVLDEAEFTLSGDRVKISNKGVRGGLGAGLGHAFLIKRAGDRLWPNSSGVVPAAYIIPLCGKFSADGTPDPINGRSDGLAIYPHAKFSNHRLPKGAIVRITIPGGAGYGDPLDRDVQLVAADVRNEWVTPEAAMLFYGVAIDPATGAPDQTETARIRAARKLQGSDSVQFQFGFCPTWTG